MIKQNIKKHIKKKYRQDNKDILNAKKREYYAKNNGVLKERNKLKQRKYRKNMDDNTKNHIKTYTHEYYIKNKDRIKQNAKISSQKYKKIRNTKRKERLFTDINYKLLEYSRRRILKAIKSKHNYKKAKTVELIGCSMEELKLYLESKFLPGMTWENHGFGDDKWHIDHIIPCSFFNLTNIEEQRKCFHIVSWQGNPMALAVGRNCHPYVTYSTNKK